MEVREEVRQMAGPLAEESGYELVDVEHGSQGHRRVIRVLLDKPGGISIADCERFSRRLSDCLDMNQTVPGSYQLEVSSPGIERPLTTLAALERFAGRRSAVVIREAHEGRRNFEGQLLVPRESRVGVRTDDGVEHWFEWAAVKSARLVVDPWARSDRGARARDSRPPRGRRGTGGAG